MVVKSEAVRIKRLSPQEVAESIGVGEVKVRRWIELKLLRAVDVATQTGPGHRRRWRIAVEDLAAFEVARSNGALSAAAVARRSQPLRAKEVTEFIS